MGKKGGSCIQTVSLRKTWIIDNEIETETPAISRNSTDKICLMQAVHSLT